MKRTFSIFACILAGMSSAAAQVIVTPVYSTASRTAFAVSDDDLINAGSTFLTSGPTSSNFSQLISGGLNFDLDNINDGSNSNINGSIVQTGTGPTAGSESFTVDFFLGNNPGGNFGFDISSITITSNGGDRRVNQDIEVLYRLVGETSFVSLHSYEYTPNTGTSGTFSAQSVLAMTGGGNLVGGINAIRFRTYVAPKPPTDSTAHTVWSEFDVVGVAAIPEPGSLALLGVGVVFLIGRRRVSRC